MRTKKNVAMIAGTPKMGNILTLEERINVIKQLESGKLCRRFGDELGVEKTQIDTTTIKIHTEKG